MRTSALLFNLCTFLLYPAIISTTVLYLYPIFFGCAFPVPSKPQAQCILEPSNNDNNANIAPSTTVAPFRLLVLADPQLEGDSSLPPSNAPLFPHFANLRATVSTPAAIAGLLTRDLPAIFAASRKRLDLLGNDYYLAHISRTLNWWLQPTHTTVLGDLIGSQWVSDGEFTKRGQRYWQRVLRGKHQVPKSVTATRARAEVLGQDTAWSDRIMNVAGNHDIGYAGDLDRKRVQRFEEMYGAANWDVRFTLPVNASDPAFSDAVPSEPPELRVVVLNDMNMDGPAVDPTLQAETYAFVNEVISTSRPVEDRLSATILLTHIPLHKEEGVCVDAPFFDYVHTGIREQNHLSPTSSRHILEGIFGMSERRDATFGGKGRHGIILTGHDHEGCDVYHYAPRAGLSNPGDPTAFNWKARRWERSKDLVADDDMPGIREITVRSMMGSFGGNAGMLSAWFDAEEGGWVFEYETCPLGVQHIWWAVHVLDLVVMALAAGAFAMTLWEKQTPKRRKVRSEESPNGSASKGKRD